MTGPMALHLVASSTATDTDWLARGHQLQVRVASTDVPTHLPGWIDFDSDRPLRGRRACARAACEHDPVRRELT